MKLLLVEDDPCLSNALARDLTETGYHVDMAWDGPGGLEMAMNRPYNLIILDGMLPGFDGWEFLDRLRLRSAVPVLMLTARDAVRDRVSGLEAGADDYLTKPFHYDELVARIKALLRRESGNQKTQITRGDIVLDQRNQSVEVSGQAVELTGREYLILLRLMSRKGSVHSHDSLADYLNTHDDEVISNTVEVHIHRLRKKVGKDRIRTIRGLGYTIPESGS